jgi:TIR domain
MTASRNTRANARVEPRVFISYARSDGEPFATGLRQRLEAKHIPLWQDRVSMEGGRDWWQQITEALDFVEFMVLIMTPAAMQSDTVRKEWRYSRQQGVCAYPVKGAPDLNFNSLPHWMRSAHFYDLDYEWSKFLNDLNTRCQQPRVPFMVEGLPLDFVPRPKAFEALIEKLLDHKLEEPIAITAALHGAGGYGKTTMARALCHNEKIGVDQIDRGGCVSALEHTVLACHYLLPIVSAIPLLEVLVACEPLWDRVSLGAVTLGEVEAKQRVISGVEQVDAQHFGPGATMTIRTALEAHSPHAQTRRSRFKKLMGSEPVQIAA